MTASEPKRRSAWVAGLLSLLQPGLGQLYCGRWRAAALFYALFFVWIAAAFVCILASSPLWFIVGYLLAISTILLVLAAIVEAVIGARRMREFRPAWYTRWYTCLLVYFVVVVAMSFYSGAVRAHMAAYHMSSASMTPALQVGDYITVQRSPPGGPMIRSGDIVVFQAPLSISPDRADWVKRIIGLPGDHIQMKSGVLWINGQPVKRERIADYVDENGSVVIRYIETLPNGVSHTILEQQGDNGVLDNTSEDIVPPDHFYVLGDNRDDSMDSRVPRMGPVPNDNYRGRVMFIYWSRNWRRIGNVQ